MLHLALTLMLLANPTGHTGNPPPGHAPQFSNQIDTPFHTLHLVDADDHSFSVHVPGFNPPGTIQGLHFKSLTKADGFIRGTGTTQTAWFQCRPWLRLLTDLPVDNQGPRDLTFDWNQCQRSVQGFGPWQMTWDNCPASSYVLTGGSWTPNLHNSWTFSGTFNRVLIVAGQNNDIGQISIRMDLIDGATEPGWVASWRWFPEDEDSDGDVDGDDLEIARFYQNLRNTQVPGSGDRHLAHIAGLLTSSN